jgi:transposase
MTYSVDFRTKVLKIKKEQRMSYAEASEFFGLSKTTLLNWRKKLIPAKGRKKPATKIDMDELALDVKSNPDKYQYERARSLGVSTRTVGYALKRLGATYKKKPKTSEGKRRYETHLPGKNKELSRRK